jgi:hypothetical protein
MKTDRRSRMRQNLAADLECFGRERNHKRECNEEYHTRSG